MRGGVYRGDLGMQVQQLRPKEAIGLNFERLERFWRKMGPEDGELALGAAMEDIALMLSEIGVAWEMGDAGALRIRAFSLQGMAERLGLPLLAQVAGDVIALCFGSDDSALAATVSRVQRVGEQSLFAIWDAQVPVG